METVTKAYVVLTTRSGVSWNAAYGSEREAYRVATSLLESLRKGSMQEDVAAFHENRLILGEEGAEGVSVPMFSCRIKDLECVAVRSWVREIGKDAYIVGMDDEDDDE